MCVMLCFFFFQAEDGIRDLVRSRGLGDVYKRQGGSWNDRAFFLAPGARRFLNEDQSSSQIGFRCAMDKMGAANSSQSSKGCLLYTSDAADERSSVDLGGRRIIKKKKRVHTR